VETVVVVMGVEEPRRVEETNQKFRCGKFAKI
jgi:hypothetical protein